MSVGHIVLAYFSRDSAAAAHVVPCVLRVGVWAVVKNTLHKPHTWQIIHTPSGVQLRTYGTKREASKACRKLGEAFRIWAFDCGFGDPPAASEKIRRLAGYLPMTRVG